MRDLLEGLLSSLKWQKRILALALLSMAILTGVLGWWGEDPAGPDPLVIKGGDFVSFWAGGAIMDAGDSARLYESARAKVELARLFPAKPPKYPLSYPPPIYQVCAALQGVDYCTATRVFLVAMTALSVLGTGLVVREMEGLQRFRPLAWAACIVSPPLISMVITGQIAGLWLASFGVAVWGRCRGGRLMAGLPLGILMAKPSIAAPMALVLLVMREGRMLAGMLLSTLVLMAISAGLDPVAWSAWVASMLSGGTEKIWFLRARQHCLRTLVGWFGERGGSDRLLGWLGALLGLFLVLGVAQALGRLARKEHGRWRLFGTVSDPSPLHAWLVAGTMLSACFLATPHILDYDLGFHLPGLLMGAAWILAGRARWPRFGAVFSVLAWLISLIWPLNRYLQFSLSTVVLLVWVLWLATEGWRAAIAPPPAPAGRTD